MVIALVGLLLPIACKEQPNDDKGKTQGQAASSSWEGLDTGTFADAELKIERLRKQTTVDWSAVRAEYDKTLPVVRFMDEHKGLSYEAEIAAAFGKCERGESPKVNQQVIAKGLQHVAVVGIEQALTVLAGKDAAAKRQAVKRIADFAKGIRPTFVRRDKDYFGAKPTLVAQLDAAVGSLRTAVDKGQPTTESGAALMDVIAQTYALGVRYEIEQVEKLRQTDLKACEVKRKEAVIFFRIIAERVAKAKPEARGTIEALLKATPDQMSASILKQQLKSGLPSLDFPE